MSLPTPEDMSIVVAITFGFASFFVAKFALNLSLKICALLSALVAFGGFLLLMQFTDSLNKFLGFQ